MNEKGSPAGSAGDSPECSSLSNVEQGLHQGKVRTQEESTTLTPSLWNPLLRYNLSPTASRKSTLRTKEEQSVLPSDETEEGFRTFAGHINYQVDVDIKIARGHMVHAKLKVRPTPEKLPNIVCYKKKGDKSNKEGEETTLARACAIG
jgi:hypothetical protein